MDEIQRRTIKDALLKCAEEQKDRPVYTGEVIPSLICKAAEERIRELEKENAELKTHVKDVENDSNNCEHWSYTRIKELEEEIEKLNTAHKYGCTDRLAEGESLNSQLENLCKWETDIEDTLSDYEKCKYDDNEHQFVVDAFTIMNGILNDIRRVK